MKKGVFSDALINLKEYIALILNLDAEKHFDFLHHLTEKLNLRMDRLIEVHIDNQMGQNNDFVDQECYLFPHTVIPC